MKLVHLIMILSVLFLLGGTILYEMDIPSPGSTGMNSQSDFDAMKQTDSRYSENVDVSLHEGVLERRVAVKRVNDTNRAVYGGAACYDMGLNKRVIVGVLAVNDTASIYSRNDTTYVDINAMGMDSMVFGNARYFKSRTGHDLGILRASDSFGNLIKINIPNDVGTRKVSYCSKSAYHDFTKFGDLLIHADGSGLPSVFSMKNYDDSASPDTMMYGGRFIDLSPERPGQPRVRAVDLNTTTKLNGIYEYCYAILWVDADDSLPDFTQIYDTSFHSIIIEAKNKNVLIDGFLDYTFRYADYNYWNVDKRGSGLIVFRRTLGSVSGHISLDTSIVLASQWKCIAKFFTNTTTVPLIVDSGQVDSSLLIVTLGDCTMGAALSPGAIYGYRTISLDTIHKTDIRFEYPDSFVRSIGWSWYDPQTGIESALNTDLVGDSSKISIRSVDSSDTIYRNTIWSLPYLSKAKVPTNWFRVYRSTVKSSLAGAGDKDVLYCIYQIPTDASLHKWEGSTFTLGAEPDSMLANGFINTSLLDQSYAAIGSNDSYLTNAGTPYTMDNETYNYSGEEVIRPPVVNPLVIPFEDMEYSNGRLWGIGDPLYPQRLYYSGFDDAKQTADINDWSVNYYFSMDENENDELVGIEKAESGIEDVLYIFKHNRIYVVTGTDPQSDMTIQSLTAEYGALNRFCIFKKNNSIFFMDKRHRIYGLANGQAAWISQPIQDYVDSVFAPHDSYIRVYALDNKINFIQTYPQDYRAVSFNELTGTWSVEKYYANVVPAGSFQYDTNRATVGFGNQSWWIFENDTGAAYFWRECTGKYDSVGGTTIYRFPVKYQTSFVGDGKNLWQIQYVQLSATVDSAQYLVAKVKDQDGVVRSADSILVTPDAWRNYTIGLPNYQGMWLSVEISGAISKLDDVKLTMRKVGSAPLR